MPSFQHWKIQAQSLCLTLYLCLYLYFSSWAVEVAHVTESLVSLANTESGRCLCFLALCFYLYLWFSNPRCVDSGRGSCLWFPVLANTQSGRWESAKAERLG